MKPSLYEAATSGDVGFLKRISDGEVSIDVLNQKTPKDNNILHIAAEFKQIKFFEYLLPLDNQSPLFWATNKKGNTPLHVAARIGCDEVVRFLVQHANDTRGVQGDDQESGLVDDEAHKRLLRKTNLETDTALHVAARCGHGGVVTLLMEADPELCCLTNSANESPLFLAICQGSLLMALSILKDCPISPSFEGINGVTALHAAITRINKTAEEIVKIIVSTKPEAIKKVDALGWSPLHYAAFRGNLEATRVLMQCDSADSYTPDKSGMSALHVAAYAGRVEVMKEIIRCRPDTCDLLNDKGQTVLHAAVLGGRTNVVKYVLKTPKLAGLLNEGDEGGNTPLHLAAIYQNREILKVLTRDHRVNKTAINKEFSKAVDIFVGDNFDQERQIRGDRLGLHHLDLSVGVPFLQEQINRDFKKLEFPENDSCITPALNIQEGKDKKEKSQAYLDQALNIQGTKLLVATLVATVTFAAGLTVPGGVKSNDGTAVLHKNTFYKVFAFCNTISFLLSVYTIMNGLMTVVVLQLVLQIRLPSPHSIPIFLSIFGMFLAFCSGVMAMQPKSEYFKFKISLLGILGEIIAIPVLSIGSFFVIKTLIQTISMGTKIRQLRNRVI